MILNNMSLNGIVMARRARRSLFVITNQGCSVLFVCFLKTTSAINYALKETTSILKVPIIRSSDSVIREGKNLPL